MLNLHPLYYHTSLIICQRRTWYPPPLCQKGIRHAHLNGLGILPPEVEVAAARNELC